MGRGAQRIQLWRSLEVVGSNYTTAQRLFSNENETSDLSLERYVEIWVCEQGIKLLSNWLGDRVIPPKLRNLRGLLFLIELGMIFLNFFFPSHNFLIVFFNSFFGILVTKLWLEVSYLITRVRF